MQGLSLLGLVGGYSRAVRGSGLGEGGGGGGAGVGSGAGPMLGFS